MITDETRTSIKKIYAIYGLCRSFGRRFIKKNIERTDEVGFGEPNKVKKTI